VATRPNTSKPSASVTQHDAKSCVALSSPSPSTHQLTSHFVLTHVLAGWPVLGGQFAGRMSCKIFGQDNMHYARYEKPTFLRPHTPPRRSTHFPPTSTLFAPPDPDRPPATQIIPAGGDHSGQIPLWYVFKHRIYLLNTFLRRDQPLFLTMLQSTTGLAF
jgi:hypothetical protein